MYKKTGLNGTTTFASFIWIYVLCYPLPLRGRLRTANYWPRMPKRAVTGYLPLTCHSS